MNFKPLKDFAPRVLAAAEFSESPIESLLFWALMNHDKFILCKPDSTPEGAGYFVFPQKYIDKYRVDFYILARDYITNPKLAGNTKEAHFVIECDGKDYHSSEEQIARDKERDAFLQKEGYKVIRFTGSDITLSSSGCASIAANEIWHRLRALHG